ncbi:MAG: C39 family peptidase [Anaerolineae bacterium]|nr:C39 family peptidase [Anaerolineae bacterium]
MSAKPAQRRSTPWFLWSVLLVFAAAIVAAGILVALVWEQAVQIRSLRGELDDLQRDHQRLAGTAAALEERLAVVETSSPAEQLASVQQALEASGNLQDHEELRSGLAQVQSQVDSLQTMLDSLSPQTDSQGSVVGPQPDTLPPQVRLDVARQKQAHNLSCESSAASMAAQYHQVSLSEADVLAALPQNENPYLGFRGNVDGPTGGTADYGVYAGPVQQILNKAGLRATPIEGGLAAIRAALARGNPVIAWITYNCQVGTPVTQVIGGQTVTLVPYQHVVVLTGYNQDGMWANDPWDGQEDFYSNSDLRRAMAYFDNMALEVAAP